MVWGIGLGRRLAQWRQAGLIDAQTAERIAAFEAANGRPRLALALGVLGAFTIGVGIVAIIAANWDAIPVGLRLGLHVLINLGLGGAVWHWSGRREPGLSTRVEGGVLLLSLSTLALIAHVGQSFQLQGSAAGLLGGWLLLASPFTFVLARSGMNRWVWTLGLFSWAGALAVDHWEWLQDHRLLTTMLVLVVLALHGSRAACPPLPPVWARHAGQVALGAAVLVLSIMLLILAPLLDEAGTAAEQTDALLGAVFGVVTLTGSQALIPADRRGVRAGWGVALILAPPLAILPVLVDGVPGAIITGAAFCLYWIGLARLALLTQRTGLFRLAVALVAARVFVAYLDAAGGLMATGLGLVLAGLVLITLGFAARRAVAWGAAQKAGDRP